jgi:lipoprotein-anchoring transpeptidase ErfK/SrfK
MPVGKPVLALGLGTCIAVGLFASVAALRPRSEKASAPPPSADVGSLSGSRYHYPADALPRIVLSDGRTETIRSVLNVRKRMRYGEAVWNEDAVPPGPIWIRVDLTRQLLSVFRGGHEIGTAVVLYGAGDKPSPEGTFAILQKAEDYHSRTYDAPMPFTLRLTEDGVAIHGANVRRRAATHGCIGVPEDFARRLFARASIGDTVSIERSGGPTQAIRPELAIRP